MDNKQLLISKINSLKMKLEASRKDIESGKIYDTNLEAFIKKCFIYVYDVERKINILSDDTIKKVISDIDNAINLVEKYKKNNVNNIEKYYHVTISKYVVKEVLCDDIDLGYDEREKLCSDNNILIEDYITNRFLFITSEQLVDRHCFMIVAVDDGKGLHELITGKTLKKWEEFKNYNEDYLYYESLEPVSKEEVAENLADLINSKERIGKYKEELNKKIIKYKDKHVKKIEKEQEGTYKKEEAKRKQLKNMQSLDSFRKNK